jgi:hypothetical protein
MSGQLPWSTSPPSFPTNDPNELLRRIEQNTSNQLLWTKIMVVGFIVVLLVVVFV